MNILIDDAIFRLQVSGGISTLWTALTPHLKVALSEFTFDAALPADVFLSTYYQPAPQGAASIVLCYDFIACRYPGLKHRSDVVWQRAAIEQASAVIAISEWSARDVRRFTGKSATVAYPSTTLTRASHAEVQAFKARYTLPDSYVLMVGNRGLYKNGNAYWQAHSLMNPRPFTVCVGGEPMADSASCKHLRLEADELPAAYTGATCLIYPSLYEGFGLPVLEAYACGCPVICGSGGALAEINEAARVANVTRPMEIAQALVDLHDHGVRIEHILKGYDVAARFSWQQMAQQMADVIRRVAEKGSISAPEEVIFVASPVDVLHGDAARAALAVTNDAARYTEGKGVLTASLERWQQAQVYERATWLEHGLMLTEDCNAEHAVRFDFYSALPENLGNAIELGCGPFTNMIHILKHHEAQCVTLVDPLAESYMAEHPHCTYRGHTMGPYPVSVFGSTIEDFSTNDQFDTLVMINVLPHCQSVEKVFGWINSHLKTGGHMVFCEPARDIDPLTWYDVGHPLSYTQEVIEEFLTGYEPLFRNGDYFIGVKNELLS